MESIFRYNCKLEEGAYTRGGAYNRMHSFCIKVEPIIGGPITGRGPLRGSLQLLSISILKKKIILRLLLGLDCLSIQPSYRVTDLP